MTKMIKQCMADQHHMTVALKLMTRPTTKKVSPTRNVSMERGVVHISHFQLRFAFMNVQAPHINCVTLSKRRSGHVCNLYETIYTDLIGIYSGLLWRCGGGRRIASRGWLAVTCKIFEYSSYSKSGGTERDRYDNIVEKSHSQSYQQLQQLTTATFLLI